MPELRPALEFVKPSFAAVIPVLNEAESIAAVIAELPPSLARVIVVDSGSTDGTVAIAEAAGAEVVRVAARRLWPGLCGRRRGGGGLRGDRFPRRRRRRPWRSARRSAGADRRRHA
jgi:glycosyltransferase involved in cell wall biosynthesis